MPDLLGIRRRSSFVSANHWLSANSFSHNRTAPQLEVSPAKSGADREPDIILPVSQQAREQMGIYPVNGNPQPDSSGHVEVAAPAHAKEPGSVGLMSTRGRNLQ